MPRRALHTRFVVGVAAIATLVLSIAAAPVANADGAPGTAGLFVPVDATLVNSSTGLGTPAGQFAAMTPRVIQVTGASGIPTTNVAAVALTVVAVNPSADGQMSAGPASGALSGVMRYNGGTYTSNSAIVAVDENGQISVQTTTVSNVAIHVQGYYTAGNGSAAAGGYTSVTMTRTVDTINGVGLPHASLAGGQTYTIQVAGTAGVPTGATAAFVNFQVDNNGSAAGYINPYATSSTTRPGSVLNYPASTPYTSIGAIVPINAQGKILVYVSPGSSINLLMDVEGYFSAATATPTTGAFTSDVAKVYDTRSATHVAPNATVNIPLAGVAGIPPMKLGLAAAVLNLTVIDAGSAGGSARAWPHGVTEPSNVGDITFGNGTTTNLMTVAIGSNGSIDIHNRSTDTVDYILDLEGWYAIPPQPTVNCPAQYAANTWVSPVPSSPISCTINVPDTGDTAGTLTVSVDGADALVVPLPASGALSQTVQVPATWGWHQVRSWATYSDNAVVEASTSFGLENGTPSAVLQAIQHVVPTAFQNITTGQTSSSGTVAIQSAPAESADGSASVARDPNSGITVTTNTESVTDPDTGTTTIVPGGTVVAKVPTPSTAGAATVEAPGIVSFDNHNGSHTVTVVKDDTSVQNFNVIDSSSAPSTYTYPLTVPAGASVSLDASSGMVNVTASDGSNIGGISPAWALDANGTSLPTYYTVSGSSVTQTIDLSSSTIAYPVVSDPWLGGTIFKRISYYPNGYPGEKGPIYSLVTSTWGRLIQLGVAQDRYGNNIGWINGQIILKSNGWAEATKKYPGLKTKATYRQQFECHVLGAYTPHTGGVSWDLEGWRPSNPGWIWSVAFHHCNWK